MPLVDATTLRVWLLGDPARWPLLAGCGAVGADGARKRIAAATGREVIFGRAGDFATRETLCRRFSAFDVSGALAGRIARELRAEEEAAAARAGVRRIAEEEAAARAAAREAARAEAEVRARARRIAAEAAAAEAEAVRVAEERAAAERAAEERRRRDADADLLVALEARWRDVLAAHRIAAKAAHAEGVPALRRAVAGRGITTLYHFTRLASLASILRSGIKPRSELPPGAAAVNDRSRHDHARWAASLSVGFPNHRVFHAFRERDALQPWVVLVVSAEILFEQVCLFNPTNAGNHLCADLPWPQRATPAAFERMFAEDADWATPPIRREALAIPAHFPTDPQAEVLAEGTVPTSRIERVAFEAARHLRIWSEAEPGIAEAWRGRLVVSPGPFKPRSDFRARSRSRPPVAR